MSFEISKGFQLVDSQHRIFQCLQIFKNLAAGMIKCLIIRTKN